MLKYIVCLCRGCDGCCVLCFNCEAFLICTWKLVTICLNPRLSICWWWYIRQWAGRCQKMLQYNWPCFYFALDLVSELCRSVRKHIFYVFIDVRKDFDSVDISLLWHKLFSYKMNGKLLTVIRQMNKNKLVSILWYPDISCVISGNLITITLCLIY